MSAQKNGRLHPLEGSLVRTAPPGQRTNGVPIKGLFLSVKALFPSSASEIEVTSRLVPIPEIDARARSEGC